MTATNRRLKDLAARLTRDHPNRIERARAYASPIHQVLADSAPDAFPELRRWLRDMRRAGLTHDQVSGRLLDDLYATVKSAEVEDECQITGH
jgi:hypothetical protein